MLIKAIAKNGGSFISKILCYSSKRRDRTKSERRNLKQSNKIQRIPKQNNLKATSNGLFICPRRGPLLPNPPELFLKHPIFFLWKTSETTENIGKHQETSEYFEKLRNISGVIS